MPDIGALTSGEEIGWASGTQIVDSGDGGLLVTTSGGTTRLEVKTDGQLSVAGALIAGTANNTIDPAVDPTGDRVTLLGGGTATFYSQIGILNAIPQGTDYTKPSEWAADSAYVSGAAGVTVIGGGYDHVNNQLAGTICGGGHHFIKYNVQGHSTIVGGSYNLIDQGRGFIGAGTNNALTGTADVFSVIVGGTNNWVEDASHAGILSGYDHRNSGDASVIAGGRANTINALANYSAVLGGQDNVVDNAYATASGRAASTVADYSATIGCNQLNEVGDAQSFKTVQAVRTTNATLTNCTLSIDLPDDRVTVGTAKVKVIAVRDGSADGNNDADYAQGSWAAEMGFYWDGTNGYLYDASGATSKTASPTRDLTAIRDDITVGALPHIAINTGAMRVKVTGVASTVINWVAEIEAVMTRVD